MMGIKKGFRSKGVDDVTGYVLSYLNRMKPKSVSELGNYKDSDIVKVKNEDSEDPESDFTLSEDLGRGGKYGIGDLSYEEKLIQEKSKKAYARGSRIAYDYEQLDSSAPKDLICELPKNKA